MNTEQQLKLQAYLDGELSDREAREVSDWLAKDNDAALLLSELTMTKTVVAANQPEYKLPETREFFWSKIEREINRLEAQPTRAPQPTSVFGWVQRYFAPLAAGAAAVALLAVIAIKTPPSVGPVLAQRPTSQLAESESFLEDMGLMTFRSQADQLTVVWLYDKSDSKVADTASDATLDEQ